MVLTFLRRNKNVTKANRNNEYEGEGLQKCTIKVMEIKGCIPKWT
jgi:hypothetical protein